MAGRRFRIYSQEFKLAAVRRVLAGEKIRAVARELRLGHLLYTWVDYYEQGGADALVPRGRPRKAVAWARRRALVQEPSRQARVYGTGGGEPPRDSRPPPRAPPPRARRGPPATTAIAASTPCCGARAGPSTTSGSCGSCARITCCVCAGAPLCRPRPIRAIPGSWFPTSR